MRHQTFLVTQIRRFKWFFFQIIDCKHLTQFEIPNPIKGLCQGFLGGFQSGVQKSLL